MFALQQFFHDEWGATAIEYGLVAAIMGLAILAVFPVLARAISGKFSSLAGHISSGS